MTKISLTRPLHKSIPLRRRALKAFLGWVAFAFGLVWFGLVLGSQRDRTEIELKCRQLKLLREIFGLRVFALRLCGWGMWGVWGNATPFDDACVCVCVCLCVSTDMYLILISILYLYVCRLLFFLQAVINQCKSQPTVEYSRYLVNWFQRMPYPHPTTHTPQKSLMPSYDFLFCWRLLWPIRICVLIYCCHRAMDTSKSVSQTGHVRGEGGHTERNHLRLYCSSVQTKVNYFNNKNLLIKSHIAWFLRDFFLCKFLGTIGTQGWGIVT